MPTVTAHGLNYSNTEAVVALVALQSHQKAILQIANHTVQAIAETKKHMETCTEPKCKHPIMVMVEPNIMQAILAVVPLGIEVAKEEGKEAMAKAMALSVQVN